MSEPLQLRDDITGPTTIDVIYDHIKGVVEQQLGDQVNLDGKMVQVFTAASVVMGLTGLSATTATKNPAVVTAFLALALAAYVGVAVISGVELWTRKFNALRFGSTLWEHEWDQPPEQVKLAVIDKVKGAYDANGVILHDKGALLVAGIVATGLEVVFVAVSIIVRVAS
jgi:hypothetical protein